MLFGLHNRLHQGATDELRPLAFGGRRHPIQKPRGAIVQLN